MQAKTTKKIVLRLACTVCKAQHMHAIKVGARGLGWAKGMWPAGMARSCAAACQPWQRQMAATGPCGVVQRQSGMGGWRAARRAGPHR